MGNKAKVPQYHQMFIPLLNALKDLGGSANIDELDAKTIEIMKLPDSICNILHKKNSTRTEVSYRLAWARTYLKKYGIIDNSKRAVWSFTEKFNGNIDTLKPDEIVQKVRSLSTSVDKIKLEDDDLENDGIELPEEIETWRDKLKEILMSMPSDAFERLTLRLLRESGFTQLEVTGKPSDGGIDGKGIIRLNGIMSFHMLFQCKKYKNQVSSSAVRDFRGAMQGRADKGLLITTGVFTSEARKEATRDGAPAIDLIDGDALVEKLKELGLGISEKVFKEYEINEEWFNRL